ncbi:hypothetical protein GF327_02445 [Candidatus Woesearchaeota archaeon]|nr:hypothetical protein [Candidatus Woesearchaeota archaeon]
MINQIILILRLMFAQVKSLSEIPGVVWSIVGVIVAVVSFFTIRNTEKPFIFYLTLVLGIGMLIYGIYKIFNMRKSTEKRLDKKMRERRQRPYTPREPHNAQRTSGPFGQNTNIHSQTTNQASYQNQHIHGYAQTSQQKRGQNTKHVHQQSQRNPNHKNTHTAQGNKFCPNCKNPVHGHHRFCANCGQRLI